MTKHILFKITMINFKYIKIININNMSSLKIKVRCRITMEKVETTIIIACLIILINLIIFAINK